MANILEIASTYKDNFTAGFNKSIKSAQDSTDKLSNKVQGLTGLLPQQFQGIGNSLGDVTQGLSGATAALGPYGIAAAAAVSIGVGLFTNAMIIGKEMKSLKNILGGVTESMRIQAKVISGTFDLSLKEVAKTTEKLSNTFNVTDEYGLQILQQGLSKTTAESKDFIDTFSEFSPIFKDMGLNIKQATALTGELLNKGFGQKGADAVKEFGIKFSELGKTQQDALSGIGINWKTISQNVKSGSITQFDAMKLISTKISQLGSGSTQAKAALTAMFGGPGEDLGMSFQETLSKINTNLDEMPSKLSDIETATVGLSTAWETFKGVLTGGEGGQNIISATISTMIDSLANLLTMFNNVFNASNWLNTFKALANIVIKVLLLPFTSVITALETIGKATGNKTLSKLGSILQFDVETNNIGALGTELKNSAMFGSNINKPGIGKGNIVNKELATTKDQTKSMAETRDIKSLVINIENVVREQHIETNEDPRKIAKLVSMAMTTAITDVKLSY